MGATDQTEEDMMGFDYAAKIQGLLANADNESLTDEARATYRAKAEELMVKYRIAEEEALATDEASATPILRDVRVTTGFSELNHYYQTTFGAIARHCGIRHTFIWNNGYVARVVGYEGDVRYAEFLWTSALLMFSTRIDPTWDDTLPEDENIWRLRNAGIERRKIADRAWGNGREAAARSKVQRIYVRECNRRGEPIRAAGLGYQTDTYRQAYAESFRDTLRRRLQEARDAADSVRGGLVLHGREERVEEAFYGHFPHLRPRPATDAPAGPSGPCPKCAKAKSGHCKDHKPWLPTKADYRRWDRMENSASALAGQASGRSAAEGVVIVRGHERPNRVDSGNGKAIEG